MIDANDFQVSGLSPGVTAGSLVKSEAQSTQSAQMVSITLFFCLSVNENEFKHTKHPQEQE